MENYLSLNLKLMLCSFSERAGVFSVWKIFQLPSKYGSSFKSLGLNTNERQMEKRVSSYSNLFQKSMSPSLLCVGRWSFLRTQVTCSAFTGPPQHSSIYTLHSGYLLGISPFNGLLERFKQLGCEMTNARLVRRWLSLRVNFLRWRREGLRTFGAMFFGMFFLWSPSSKWYFFQMFLDTKIVDYHCLHPESHAWKEWRMKPQPSALDVSLAMWKKFPWVLLSPFPSVPYHQTAPRSMWAPLRNSETWRPTSCRVAFGQRFSAWCLGDFTLFVNGLIHFVLMHVSKRFRSWWTGNVGMCPFWNVIGTKKTFSWLVGLKRGSVSAFLLVLVQDILKKRTEEVKLRNPQGIPKTSCVFLSTKNSWHFPKCSHSPCFGECGRWKGHA